MNNEPVAWAYIKDGEFFDAVHPDEHDKYEGMYTTPVYTHPAKTLTDEEIMEVFTAYEQMQEYGYVGKKPFQVSLGWSLSEQNDCLMLARAILKKASEK